MRKFGWAILLVILVWFAVVPLAAPRGYYWGYYRPVDLALGGFAIAVAITALALRLVPARKRRHAMFAVISVVVFAGGTLLALDLAYTLFVLGAIRPNYWLDRGHITRGHNVADDELGFTRRPNVNWAKGAYQTDENGFRNPRGIRSADIVFIGDSYTEAGGVPHEQTFAARVGTATGLRVVNLGRGAYGPQQELIVLRRYGLKYAPKYVVWQLFDGNDLIDADEYFRWRTGAGRGDLSLPARFFANSVSRRVLKDAFALPVMAGPLVRLELGGGGTKTVHLRYRYDARQAEHATRAVEETRRTLQEGLRLIESAGAKSIVLFIPTMAQVHRNQIRFLRRSDQHDYLPDAPQDVKDFGEFVEQWCADPGCTFLNVLETLRREAGTGQEVYFPEDEHLTPAGHAVVAGDLVQVLNRLNGRRKPADPQSHNNRLTSAPGSPSLSISSPGRASGSCCR